MTKNFKGFKTMNELRIQYIDLITDGTGSELKTGPTKKLIGLIKDIDSLNDSFFEEAKRFLKYELFKEILRSQLATFKKLFTLIRDLDRSGIDIFPGKIIWTDNFIALHLHEIIITPKGVEGATELNEIGFFMTAPVVFINWEDCTEQQKIVMQKIESSVNNDYRHINLRMSDAMIPDVEAHKN